MRSFVVASVLAVATLALLPSRALCQTAAAPGSPGPAGTPPTAAQPAPPPAATPAPPPDAQPALQPGAAPALGAMSPPAAAPPPMAAPVAPAPVSAPAPMALPWSPPPSPHEVPPGMDPLLAAREPASDHLGFVGRAAVAYFGTQTVSVGAGQGGLGAAPGQALTPTNISAPTLGVRYWLSPRVGVDAGVGLGVADSSSSSTANSTSQDSTTGGFAVTGHLGLPLALASYKHYVFEVVPEADIAVGHTSTEGTNESTEDPVKINTDNKTFSVDVGARVGSEIHFGFIGVPELALQASLGLLVHHQSTESTVTQGESKSSSSADSTTVSTTVGASPWGIFLGNVAALYYF